MPPVGTPSPFRIPPRPNPRRNKSPQFASTPRFLLSQETPTRTGKDDIDGDETPCLTPIPGRRVGRARNEGIEDPSDDELQIGEHWHRNGEITSSAEMGSGPGSSDEDFEMLFGSRKKRRVSIEPEPEPSTQRGIENREPILSSSPGPEGSLPFPDEQQEPQKEKQKHQQPSTPAQPLSQSPRTPFRSVPRFKLSQHPPSQSQSGPSFTQLPVHGSESRAGGGRDHVRKPGFILPRSPSPDPDADDDGIPTPFSPSSRTLHRRGWPKARNEGYVPGGMASEVRRWILEMGAKRGGNGAGAAGVGTGTGEKDGRNYLLTARVERVRKIERGRGSCSGRVAFVESAPLDAGEDGQVRNVLLFGTPKTKHIPASVPGEEALKPGVLIGVHKGLAWEIELDRLEGPGKEKWLVCMEWDLLDSTST